MVMGSINEVVRLMKLTETLYKRLANEAMEATQISMERPKDGDKAWRKYKFDVYNLMAEGYEVPTDSVHSPANPNNWSY